MSNATFPSALSHIKLQSNGFSETFKDGRELTNINDWSRPNRRANYRGNNNKISGSILLTSDEMATFETFLLNDLFGGVRPFTWVHPITEESAVFFMSGTPTVSAVPGSMMFSVNMELRLIQ